MYTDIMRTFYFKPLSLKSRVRRICLNFQPVYETMNASNKFMTTTRRSYDKNGINFKMVS